jgi:hypothetical protein
MTVVCPCASEKSTVLRQRHAWIAYMTAHITTIGEIEKVTRMNFLPKLSATKRAALENFKAPALWAKE